MSEDLEKRDKHKTLSDDLVTPNNTSSLFPDFYSSDNENVGVFNTPSMFRSMIFVNSLVVFMRMVTYLGCLKEKKLGKVMIGKYTEKQVGETGIGDKEIGTVSRVTIRRNGEHGKGVMDGERNWSSEQEVVMRNLSDLIQPLSVQKGGKHNCQETHGKRGNMYNMSKQLLSCTTDSRQ